MSTLSIEPALWIVARASTLIAIAALVQLVVGRRSSAAARHLVWTLAIAGVLLLPLVTWALPTWSLVVPSGAKSLRPSRRRRQQRPRRLRNCRPSRRPRRR